MAEAALTARVAAECLRWKPVTGSSSDYADLRPRATASPLCVVLCASEAQCARAALRWWRVCDGSGLLVRETGRAEAPGFIERLLRAGTDVLVTTPRCLQRISGDWLLTQLVRWVVVRGAPTRAQARAARALLGPEARLWLCADCQNGELRRLVSQRAP